MNAKAIVDALLDPDDPTSFVQGYVASPLVVNDLVSFEGLFGDFYQGWIKKIDTRNPDSVLILSPAIGETWRSIRQNNVKRIPGKALQPRPQ